MFYKNKSEQILRDKNTLVEFFLSSKETLATSLNDFARKTTSSKGKYIRYKNNEVNVIEEAISRATMFCNAIVSRGHKRILFVGHYNDHQTHWMLDKFSDRLVDILPSEREDMHSFPDLNIVAQFIPLIMHVAKYDVKFAFPRPPEEKHKGVMFDFYEKSGMGAARYQLGCDAQYKHGISSWRLDVSKERRYDAVVFLGVPMADPEVGFEEDQVREIFAPWCTPDFEMIDIYYGAPSSIKWQNGEKKDSTPSIETAFSIRSSWDEDVKEGRSEEFEIMDRMFSVY